MKRPLATIGFTAFGTLAVVFLFGWLAGVALSAAALAAFAVSLGIKHRKWDFLAVAVTAFLFMGLALFYEAACISPAKGLEGEHSFAGEVYSVTPMSNGYFRLEILLSEVDGEEVRCRISVVDLSHTEPEPYEILHASGKLFPAEGTDSSYGRYCFGKGILYTGYVTRITETLPSGKILLPAVNCFSRGLSDNLRRFLSGETEDMACAMVLGERYQIRSASEDLFEKTGLSHVLAVSGLHVSLVGMFLLFALRFLHMSRRVSYLLAMCFVWFFAAMVQFRPSAVRAAILFSFCSIGDLIEEKNDTLNALGGACLLILILSPQTALDVSFQLSVLAVAGIATVTVRLQKLLRKRICNRALLFVGESLSVTAGAYIYNLPVLAMCYGGMYPAAFLSNLVLLPLFTVFLALSFVVGLLGFLPVDFVTRAIAFCARLIGTLLHGIMEGIASVFTGWLPLFFWPCAILSLTAFCLWMIYRHRKTAAVMSLAGGLCAVILFGFAFDGYNTTALYIAAGEETAALVSVRRDEMTVLSGSFSESEILALRRIPGTEGVRCVTAVYADDRSETAPNGLLSLCEAFPVGTVFTAGGAVPPSAQAEQIPSREILLPTGELSVKCMEEALLYSLAGTPMVICPYGGGNLLPVDGIMYRTQRYDFCSVSDAPSGDGVLHLRPGKVYRLTCTEGSMILEELYE